MTNWFGERRPRGWMLCAVRSCRSYIEKHFGGAENFSTQDLQQAMTHMRENLDGSDKGQTISESEVEDHLRSLMQVRVPLSCRQLTSVACSLWKHSAYASYHHAFSHCRKGRLPTQAWLHHSSARQDTCCSGKQPTAGGPKPC